MAAAEPKKVHLLFIKIKNVNPELYTRYLSANSVSEKTLQSSLSTVRVAIKIFSTPSLRKCTATNSFDLASFRKTKSVLYICTPLNDVSYYAPLSALLFSAVFKEMMHEIPKPGELSVYCLIDEMVQMKFQDLGLVFSNCRKYRLGCVGIVQDEKMLEMSMTVPEAHAVKTNCYSKVYLPGQPLQTCKQLEEILGKYSCRDEKTGTEKIRPLMSASDIRMCKDAIILVGNEAPIKAKMKPYYSHWKLKKLTKIAPYILPQTVQLDPPLIAV